MTGDHISDPPSIRATTGRPEQRDARLSYVPGLDGLRALAVVAVLLYHAGLPVWGGFLGVESFFVVSGFLITALLLVEWQQHSRIDLPAFWLRRARRLLPALMLLLVGTLLFAGLAMRGELVELRADSLAALGYVMNLRLILSGGSYFDPLVRPPLLQHLWSLAIEEQFYLIWPLLFGAGMRRLRAPGLLAVTLAVAVASAMLMAGLYQPGADPSRIYYGTDTRAAGLLLGAALALAWPPGSPPAATNRRFGMLLDSAGVLALGGLIICFVRLSAQHPLLYRGGFALIALSTAIVIAALTHPCAWLVPRLLGWTPLRWIGLRSYGIYLWHWPVFMVTRPFLDLPLDGLPLLGLRLAIVGVLVELSYRYIEMPVRHGALKRAWRGIVVAESEAYGALARRSPAIAYARRWTYLLLPILLVLLIGAGSSVRRAPRASVPATSATIGAGSSVRRAPRASVSATSATIIANRPAATIIANESAAITAPQPTASPTAVMAALAAGTALPMDVATIPTPAEMAELTVTQPEATPTPGVPLQLDPALAAGLQQLLDDTVAGGYIPGAVVSVSIPGYLPWSGASGVADRNRGVPMDPNTQVHLASITKMFTAVVVLQLAEEGKLDLDAPISTWLPGIVWLADTTTARHLLSHTSGIFDYLEDARFFVEAYRNPQRTYTPAELVAMVDQFGAAFEPGTAGAWKYSSTNYVVLGMLVEQVTGRSLAEEMRQRIFEPLELTHTFFAPDEAVAGNLAQGYINASDRVDVSMTFVFATGNIISTADDLRRFVDALFNGRLLQAESRAMMTALVYTGGGYGMPELQYGLGLMGARLNVGPGPDGVGRPDEVSAVLGHIGGIAGFRSAVWWAPESGITIALSLNQADIDPNLLARDVMDTVLTWQGR